MMRFNYFLILMVAITGCVNRTSFPNGEDLFLGYEIKAIDFDQNQTTVGLTLRNNGQVELPVEGWEIFFNQLTGPPHSTSTEAPLAMQHVVGYLWKFLPGDQFEAIAAGDELVVDMIFPMTFIKTGDLPVGPFIHFIEEGNTEKVSHLISPVDPALIPTAMRPTAQSRWEENQAVSMLKEDEVAKILPTPKSQTNPPGTITLDQFILCESEEFTAESAWFQEFARAELGMNSTVGGENCNLRLVADAAVEHPEGYRLKIDGQGIEIRASKAAGIFYGLQSLINLVPTPSFGGQSSSITLPHYTVTDFPSFTYRGVHLDVSRNFHSVASIKKLLKVMSFYKLNKFHWHLTDDEGWRMNIPEIPELVSVGSRRGFSTDESDQILPSYGSGLDADDPGNHGSGYYTRQEMMDVIKLAHQLHIEVIPEIDLPGHARAAIKAVEAHIRKTGDKTYRLINPQDTSVYMSVQNYPDNVIDVCQESTYAFIELVVDQLVSIYQEAEVPLNMVHIGGDEVPQGVWEGSPSCIGLVNEDEKVKEVGQLMSYFVFRVNDLLKARGLRLGGWQEILNDRGYEAEDLSIVPFVWHEPAKGVDLANKGHDIVLCNASDLYFDLAYNRDPAEDGLNWAGYVDTKRVFSFQPFGFKAGEANETVELTSSGTRHVLGIQGELWSETLLGPDMLEYYLLPKLLGLAERAWRGDPGWQGELATSIEFQQEWNQFVNQLGQREFVRLNALYGGWNYRIPLPGVIVEDGLVKANVRFPGLTVHYTTNGGEPTTESAKLLSPIPYQRGLRLRVINSGGRGGRTVDLDLEEGVVPE